MSNLSDAVESIRERVCYDLTDLADCADPDYGDSPGAQYLRAVRDSVLEWWEDERDTSDPDEASHERVDSLVPIYNHERWTTFVDLAAYHEDLDDFGRPDDMTDAAGVALYLVGRRLFEALAQELADAKDEDGEDED
jgi:hypothetical protein